MLLDFLISYMFFPKARMKATWDVAQNDVLYASLILDGSFKVPVGSDQVMHLETYLSNCIGALPIKQVTMPVKCHVVSITIHLADSWAFFSRTDPFSLIAHTAHEVKKPGSAFISCNDSVSKIGQRKHGKWELSQCNELSAFVFCNIPEYWRCL